MLGKIGNIVDTQLVSCNKSATRRQLTGKHSFLVGGGSVEIGS